MTLRREDRGRVDETSVAAQRGRAQPLLLHRQLVGKRLYINAQVRFLVGVGIVGGTLFGRYALKIEGLDVPGLLLLAALLESFNAVIFLIARRHRDLERRIAVYRFLMGLMHLTITVDFLFLTVALWFVGGAKSPFLAFYLIHVILATALLSPRAACAHAVFGYALLSGLVLGEWRGLIPIHFPVGAVNSVAPLDGRYVFTVLFVQAMLMALAIFLLTGLTNLLRRGERQLRSANIELGRISNLQRDFLHIALHDLKSPVNAALMLLQSMKVASNPPLNEEQERWIERIRVRLNEATGFLRDFSVLALLDSADMARQAQDIDVAPLVQNAVAENEDAAQAHGHWVTIEMDDSLPPVQGIERLIHEVVANLITNAIKYTPDQGRIVVRARRNGDSVRVEVEDNGIGITAEDQKRLFQEFVRIKRKNGRLDPH